MKNDTKATEVKLEVQTREEVRLVELATDLRDTIQTAQREVGEKYVNVCKWIRSNAIPPRRVSELLLPLGYAKTRVSELNRVSQCSDELWDEYEARKIGRNRMLELVRHAEDAGAEDVSGVEGVAEENEGGEGGGGPEFVESPEDVKKRKLLTMAKCAKTIMNTAEFLNLRSKKWDLGNGWVLEVKKGGKGAKKGKGEKPESEEKEAA
jgi:hypothetical protein